ncbi:MAG: trypsin-like serine protease, partial [Thermoguttaceae bacterium]
MRRYNSDGTPRTGVTLVNTYTAGNQYQCSVGMDADGDFVVAWNSAAQESNGTSGIYAQRFNSMGTKLGSELHVNTNQANMQSVPSVAMDCFGDFAVVWANTGQDFSWYNDIRGQMFGTDGNRLGSEFLVNSRNVPGASGEEIAPSVAISDSSTHHIVVGWESATGEKNGAATNAVAMARLFSWDGTGVHAVAINGSDAQFQAEVGTDKFIGDAEHVESVRLTPRWDSSNVQVAMDPTGQFVVTWESYHDNDIVTTSPPDQIDSWGIYYRVFNANGTPQTTLDCQANQVVTCQPTDPTWVRPDWLLTQDESDQWAGNQLRSSVSMDADGDFTITWDGNGANSSSPLSPHNTFYGHDAAGVWYRRFHSTQTGYTATPAVCTQTRVNTTSAGTQIGSTITENRSGDYVVTWSVGNDVYFQRYTESTDTAGAILTDFLLPDGSSVASTSQVTQGLQAIVLTFDEAMYDNAAHTGSAVTNPKNYWLVYNGANVQGGISQVYYGYDIANTLGSQYGLNMPKVDKYQVVLVVDSNGAGAGVQALIDGQYQVAVTNALRDAAGNALNSVGPGPNGGLASGLINVSIPTGQETKVANGTTPSGATYGKYTYATTADPVASDSQGDYVVAWTDTTPGHEGVWVKMYTQTSTLNPAPTGRTTSVAEYPAINPATGSPWTNNEIRVSSDATASDISVARDVNGDFVVTWSAWNATTNWDVYAQRYSATGQPVGSAFRVNSTTAEVQRSSSVAMDAQGDFVITWQSENQDGGGYGVYAQAYNSAGQIVGGTDEIQAIDFTGGFTGTFVLRWDDDNDQFTPDKVTAPITFTGNASASLTGIENALKAIGANVKCVANGLSQVLVEFVDASGNADQQPLWIAPSDIVRTGGTASATVTTSTIVAGKFGEFRVNDTTVGDQVAPDVAMDSKGDFVITWTTFGQGSDSAGESDIYAKRYASSSLDWYPEDITSVASGLAYSGNLSNAVLHPDLSTVDNPYAHVVSAGTGYDGIGEILGDDFGDEFIGTGSLLSGTNWVLTAGHCAWSEKYNVPLVPGQLSVAFDLPAGRVVVPVTQVVVNPSFAGTANFLLGGDLALLQLAFVPVGVQGLAIYTGTDEIGKTYDIYGYGAFGTGSVGQVFDSDNVKRHGQNVFDATGAVLGYSDKQLAADFDDGTNQHDAFGSLYGIHNTDSALIANHQEAISCQGDSGGPLIIDGKIAAITSGSATLTQPPVDVDSSLDSTYGEFSIDTRISSFADWIQNVTNCLGQSEFLVNQNDIVANTGNVDSLGNPIFYALDNESGNQCDSSVAMDSAGDFVITWTSYNHDGVGNGYGAGVNGENGVFARRYNANSTAASSVFQVNQSVTGNQQNANVAMDDAGDFVITWESSNGIDTGTGIESFDIYARRYARTSLVGYTQGQIGAVPLLWSGTNSVYSVDPLFIKAVVLSDTDQVVQLAGTGNLSFNNGAIGGEVLV